MWMKMLNNNLLLSFPRRQESMNSRLENWIPAFAGMTDIEHFHFLVVLQAL
jgi:hypothetical protein